jgi:hypothetical protein
LTGLLVIHDMGGPGGARWKEAFDGWPGEVTAPDLPGHAGQPAPVGGHYELGDTVVAIAPHLPSAGPDPVVVGVGRNGHAARVLALAGRARALVLVDGLGGPWLDVGQRNAELRELRRRILATPAALAPHAPGGTDPRASFVLAPSDRRHVAETCAGIAVPTLVVETPRSPTTDADALVRELEDGELVTLGTTEPAEVAGAVIEWWERLR